MPEQKPKKSKKISDEEILKTLREAVLSSIGSTGAAKKTISTIDTSEDLSQELKTIGRKLIRKKQEKDSKGAPPKLTPKDIEKIQKITEAKTAQDSPVKKPKKQTKPPEKKEAVKSGKGLVKKKLAARPSPTPPVAKEAVPITPLPRERVQGSMKRGGETELVSLKKEHIKFLPKPSLFDRLSLSFSLVKLLILLVTVLVVLGGAVGYVFYKTDIQNPFVAVVAKGLRLPVASINGTIITYPEFQADVEALESFFNDEVNATTLDISSQGTPSRNDIQTLVLERDIRVLLIRQALERFNQSVTDLELQTQLDEVVRASGGEEALEEIVADLYQWSTRDFVEKALRPLLEEEKLTIYISQDDDLNREKKERIESIAQEIAQGLGFAEAAKQYSEDVTAANGGELDWFTPGTLVPEFEDQVTGLSIGQISTPFKTSLGWHIVELTDVNRDDPEEPLYRARHVLINHIDINEFLLQLREQAEVSVYISL